MFNISIEKGFGKANEVGLAEGLRVLIPHPDERIERHTDFYPGINADQRTEPPKKIYSYPDDGFSDPCFRVDSGIDGLTGLSSEFVGRRFRNDVKLRSLQQFLHLGQSVPEPVMADKIDTLPLGPPGGISQADEHGGPDVFQNTVFSEEIVKPHRRLTEFSVHVVMHLVQPGFSGYSDGKTGVCLRLRLLRCYGFCLGRRRLAGFRLLLCRR